MHFPKTGNNGSGSFSPFISKLSKITGWILGIILVAFSLWNSGTTVWNAYHWPILTHDEWKEQWGYSDRLKSSLREHGIDTAGYRVVELPPTYSDAEWYALQNFMAPAALHFNSTTDPYVLVQFWTSRQVKPLPDLVLLEDLGNGFGLFHRP